MGSGGSKSKPENGNNNAGGSKSKRENGNNNAGGSATQKSTTQGDNSNKSEQINYVKDSAATTSNAKSDAKTLTTSSGSKSAYKTGSEMSQKDSPVDSDKQGVKMDRVILPPINVPPPGTEPTKEDNSLANVDNKTQTASSSPKEAVNVASDSKEVVTSNQSTTSSDAKQSQTKDTKQKHKDEEQVGFKQHLNNI